MSACVVDPISRDCIFQISDMSTGRLGKQSDIPRSHTLCLITEWPRMTEKDCLKNSSTLNRWFKANKVWTAWDSFSLSRAATGESVSNANALPAVFLTCFQWQIQNLMYIQKWEILVLIVNSSCNTTLQKDCNLKQRRLCEDYRIQETDSQFFLTCCVSCRWNHFSTPCPAAWNHRNLSPQSMSTTKARMLTVSSLRPFKKRAAVRHRNESVASRQVAATLGKLFKSWKRLTTCSPRASSKIKGKGLDKPWNHFIYMGNDSPPRPWSGSCSSRFLSCTEYLTGYSTWYLTFSPCGGYKCLSVLHSGPGRTATFPYNFTQQIPSITGCPAEAGWPPKKPCRTLVWLPNS